MGTEFRLWDASWKQLERRARVIPFHLWTPPSIFLRRVFEFLGRKSKDKRLAPQAEQYFLDADLWGGWCSHSCEGFPGSYWEEKTVNLNGLTLYWSQIPYCCQPIPFSFLFPATSSSCGVTPPSPFSPFSFLHNLLWSLSHSVSLSLVTAIWLRKDRKAKAPSALFVYQITAFSVSSVKVCRLGTSDPIYWTFHSGEITHLRR